MKKFMRIALVFALAGAALVGCTKDYSGDISDLNKEVSAIQSTLTSLQTSIQGAQSAADAAAATANTALSAAKAAATADDLKAVQTALAAAATSAELTAVDAKYAAYIPAIEAAAKASDLEALETAIKAAIAATDVKVADLEKAFEAYAKKADLDEAVTKLGELETNYIALEARVAALEAADVEIQKLIDANAKGIEANAEAIEDLQKLVEELTAQVEGAFSIKGVAHTLASAITYQYSTWNPEKTTEGKKRFNKLANEFPELNDLVKGDVVKSCNNVPFIVTPSTLEFDETDSFALVNIYGEDSGWKLGAPFASPVNVKAGTAGVWFVEVLAPAYNEATGKPDINPQSDLALVVERANGDVAQTAFEYGVRVNNITKTTFKYDVKDTTYKADAFVDNSVEIDLTNVTTDSDILYDEYFVIEPVSKVDAEKYGITVKGTTLTVLERPGVSKDNIYFYLGITAIGLNGVTTYDTFKVTIEKEPISTTTDLDAQTVVLNYNKTTNSYKVAVDYEVEEFGFTPLEWDVVYRALRNQNVLSANALDEKNDGKYNDNIIFGTDANALKVTFIGEDGKTAITDEDKSEKAAYIRFELDSKTATPGEYSVKITDGKVFCAVGNVTVKNPAAKPVKIAEKLCENGVLQIVGKAEGDVITYNLEDALILTTGEVGSTFTFEDVAYKAATDDVSDQTVEENWITSDKKTFSIPTWNAKWANTYTHNNKIEQKLLNTKREFAVTFNWFDEGTDNLDTLHFWAQAVSPIWTADGSNITLKTTGDGAIVDKIYYVPEWNAAGKQTKFTSTSLASGLITGGKYVAGNKKGTTFSISDEIGAKGAYWKETAKSAWDLTDTTEVKFNSAISNSNIEAYNQSKPKMTTYLRGKDGLPVSVALVDAYNMGFVDMAFYMSKKDAETPWTYYLTVKNWESIKKLYTDITAYGYTCEYGKVNPWVANNRPTDPVVIKEYVGYSDNKYKTYSDAEKAQYNYFTTVITAIDFGEKTETSYTYVPASEGSEMSPAELAEMPFFTFEGDKAEFDKYAVITVGANKVVSKIEANNSTDPAGRKSVVIPVYANVKDIWGMTTQKKVEITLEVE